jgi:hypothetical protein
MEKKKEAGDGEEQKQNNRNGLSGKEKKKTVLTQFVWSPFCQC